MGRGKSGTGGGGSRSAIQTIYQLRDDNGDEMGRLFEINDSVYLLRQDGSINELPGTTDINGYLNNIRNNGGSAQVISKKQLAQEEKRSRAYRNQINALLDRAYVGDSTFVKGSRAIRTGRRATRRSR